MGWRVFSRHPSFYDGFKNGNNNRDYLFRGGDCHGIRDFQGNGKADGTHHRNTRPRRQGAWETGCRGTDMSPRIYRETRRWIMQAFNVYDSNE